MTAISFPKQLTAKAWRNNKGLFTTAVSDASGLGKALDKLEEKWKLVPWAEVDAQQATANLSVQDGFISTYKVANVKALKKTADESASKVQAVKSQLQTIATLAGQTNTKWQKNKLVPASSIKYLGQVQAAAKALSTQLDKLDSGWEAVLTGASVSEKLIQEKLDRQIESQISLLRGAAEAVLDKPTRTVQSKMYDHAKSLVPLLGLSALEAHQDLRLVLEAHVNSPDRYKKVTDEQITGGIGAKDAQKILEALRGL